MSASDPLHPIYDRLLSRADKEASLGQRAQVIWLYGLSGSGKSTLAAALERRLASEGFVVHVLDGDNLRTGLNRGLGFSDADRTENIRRAAEVAKLFVGAGVIVIASFITPLRAHRKLAREIIGTDDFLEVYVEASFEACRRRDPKGIYARAEAGNLTNFTGRDSTFEPPLPGEAWRILPTEQESPADSLARLHTAVTPRILPVAPTPSPDSLS